MTYWLQNKTKPNIQMQSLRLIPNTSISRSFKENTARLKLKSLIFGETGTLGSYLFYPEV